MPAERCAVNDAPTDPINCDRTPTRRGLCDAHFSTRPDLRRY